jgi:hypothetical protein
MQPSGIAHLSNYTSYNTLYVNFDSVERSITW